jgi:5-formyltetrahydrofolate cyclo-ligase
MPPLTRRSIHLHTRVLMVQNAQHEKEKIRQRVSKALLQIPPGARKPIALPDVIFDHQLDHFITDFHDSDRATQNLIELPEWQFARRVFITPDNSTQLLREAAIRQGKEVIMTTYGIRRGSVLVRRDLVPEGQEEYASTLAGMEKFGLPLPTIADLERAGTVDLMLTGALAISRLHGGRAGKGAGWFDAEWGMWKSLELVDENTPIIGIVHDIQVVAEEFSLDPWDCHMDLIVTPTEVIRLPEFKQPEGVLWDKIKTRQQRKWMAAIPYMQEIYQRQFGKPFSSFLEQQQGPLAEKD